MGLLSSIQMAGNSLLAQQIGLQVVGQNIANANTPGYSRAEAVFTPAPTQRDGGVLLGLGVDVHGVVQQIDEFLEQRLRNATSDRASSEAQQQNYQQLEQVLGALQDTGVGTSLTKFFSTINDVLNQPESASVRNLAVLQGQTLASDISNLAKRVTQLRQDINDQVDGAVKDINRLLQDVGTLNKRISTLEGGSGSSSDAIGLRDQRNKDLADLAELIDIRVQEQSTSAANVFNGGDFLVFEGDVRKVSIAKSTSNGVNNSEIIIDSTQGPLQLQSGKLSGLIAARDSILGGFQTKLDDFARTLAGEFNKVYASGQGLKGYQTITSKNPVSDVDLPLDAAGLTFAPVNGSFDVHVFNRQTGQTEFTTIPVDLNGLDDNDTTLNSLAAQLNGVAGLKATVSGTGKLTIQTTSSNLELAFGNDTSGVLTALGLNTFFTGDTATTLGVNQDVTGDPSKFAASQGGIGADTSQAVLLAGFADQKLNSAGGQTITQVQQALVAAVTQGSSATTAAADGYRSFESTLKGQQLAVSGVSIDEETVKMLGFQRAYQASAKFIVTLNELLDTLVKL